MRGASVRTAVLVALLNGCGDDDAPKELVGTPSGSCAATVATYQPSSAGHVSECSSIDYPTAPPVSGDHYPVWAAYGSYDYEIPAGYLVHNLEHGAIVLSYDCPDGCAEEVSAARAHIEGLPTDPRCSADVSHQVVLAPSNSLGSRWAGAAWGFALRAECFDADAFRTFYEEHVGRGPEDLCSQGSVIPPNACK